MSSPALLDTCAAIWLMNGDAMAPAARSAIREAVQAGELGISSVSAWEVAMLEARSRLPFKAPARAWYDELLATPGLRENGVTAALFMASCQLPGNPPRDPIDRLVIATAREGGFVIVTRDRMILAYGRAGHVRVVAC